MMNRLAYPQYKFSSYIIVAVTFALYVMVFAIYHNSVGTIIASLAIIPVIGGSWYFGIKGGVLIVMLSILANIILRMLWGHSFMEFFTSSSMIIGNFALIFIAFVVGRLSTVARERREAIIRLEELEKDRQNYTNYLESLNNITRIVLEARDLKSALKALVEQIAILFKADDGYLALWDETQKIPVPMVAYGSMRDKYPEMRFEAGKHTLAASVMKAGRPLAITDLEHSSYINPNIDFLAPNHSVLGLPLVVHGRNLAVLYLGYNERRPFDQREITYAEIAAQQIALVLTKIQLLEDTNKRVKELTVLHEVAVAATLVDTIDQLIDSATEIIGKNLYPDNFGILLMDEEKGVLRPQPSYRFVLKKEQYPTEISLGAGITGQVAKTGFPIRVGNVDDIQNYLDVDERTASELCVPIKLKERVLGVINAESTRMDAFSAEDEFLLGTLAGQLATAMEKLRAAEGERRWLNQLVHSNDLIYSLAHITNHIEKALSSEEILQVLGEDLQKIELTCLMATYDSGQKSFTVNYSSLKPEILEQLENDPESSLITHSFSLDALKSTLETQDIFRPAITSDPPREIQVLFTSKRQRNIAKIPWESGAETNVQLMRLPLVVEEKLLGILWVWGGSITGADLPVMSIFAKQIGSSLERARLFQEVQSLALTDSLTGLHNRRSLFELGRIEFSRAHRMNRPYCCMMLDIDHFKQINDNYGHSMGDKVLHEFANRCKNAVREVDLVGRYGGEELIIILPETDLSTGMQIAERLRKSVAETPMHDTNGKIYVTVSIGVAQKDENTLNLETLIARADQAMYIAKHKGRNYVATSK